MSNRVSLFRSVVESPLRFHAGPGCLGVADRCSGEGLRLWLRVTPQSTGLGVGIRSLIGGVVSTFQISALLVSTFVAEAPGS